LAADINIRIEGCAGCITLARPKALNALTHAMAVAIEEALEKWRDDDRVRIVIFDAEGERAFCAGGDVENLYQHGVKGDFSFGRKFWVDEYRMNAAIAEYPKPVIAFMQGFVMGGGVGVGCHGSHRIVCETTRIAMPECAIGLIPDVGGSWLLANAPGRIGEYLGLTGTRINAADAIFTGFADHFIPQEDWQSLRYRLCDSGDLQLIDQAASSPGTGSLHEIQAQIDQIFSRANALECLQALENDESDWAAETAKAIRRGCPLSIACAFEIIAMNRQVANVREALANELRFTWRSMSEGEFLEGVRAQIIDKDRKPDWRTRPLENVKRGQIDRMLAPIAENVAQ
jgi:enoyl-CoA hydratase